MTSGPPFIIDAGPALNFLATGNERILTNAIGRQAVHAPETVDEEVLRKSRKVKKFTGVAGRWNKMKPTWLVLLSDDSDNNPALVQAASALLAVPLRVRQRNGDDLGETMVVLHAYAKAIAGEVVYAIIDDRNGRKFAKEAAAKVEANRRAGQPVGRIQVVRTVDIIERRINTADIPDQQALKALWKAISVMDDGLRAMSLDETGLPRSKNWQGQQRP